MKRKSLAWTASLAWSPPCLPDAGTGTSLPEGSGHPDDVAQLWRRHAKDHGRLIDEFNSTLGREQGIVINVTAISSSAELNESLDMIAAGDPGAPAMARHLHSLSKGRHPVSADRSAGQSRQLFFSGGALRVCPCLYRGGAAGGWRAVCFPAGEIHRDPVSEPDAVRPLCSGDRR